MYTTIAFIVLGLVVLIGGLILREWAWRLRRMKGRLRDLEGEEHRMFAFLHDLGCAIESDTTVKALSRMIVDGIDKVVTARGGAIYYLSEDGQYLVPAYVSENCPPLIGVPVEIRKRAERDSRVLESHVRLAKVGAADGILGHSLTVGEAIRVPDVKNHEAFRDAFISYDGEVGALVAPLRHAGKDLGVLAVARLHEDGPFSGNDFAVFRSVAEQSSFAIGNANIHREAHEKRAFESELKTARDVQHVLLPQGDPVIAGYRVSGTNLPARIISGDYYDYVGVGEDRHGIAIADVSGKGVAAGLLMAMCRSVLRSAAHGESSPAKVLSTVNRQLFPDIREDMFISMSYSVLHPYDGRVVTARAGHDPALLYRRKAGTVEFLKPPGLAVGIDAGDVFERVTRDFEVVLESGDCLLFYTDGVKEAIDAKEEEFGAKRLSDVFLAAAPMGAEEILASVQRELKAFTGEARQMDDITLVAIEKR
ncbi:MAG: SpoIIE family protein phosphatase [Luteolibacter sp.]